jgi:amidase
MVLNVVGPLTRSVEDLTLALEVLAGPEAGEEAGWRLELPAPRHQNLEGFRVAVLRPLDLAPVDRATLQARDRVAETLAAAGATVQEASPDVEWEEYMRTYESLLAVMVTRDLKPEHRKRAAEEDRAHGPSIFSHAAGLEADAHTFLDWLDRREHYRQVWHEFFWNWDIVLAPIAQRPAWPDFIVPQPERFLNIDGQQTPYENFIAYPAVSTLPGLPATAFPVGLDPSGLPIGLQAIGPYLEDRTPLRFAALLSERIGGYAVPPGYA